MSNKPTQSTNACSCNKSGNKAAECKCSKNSSCCPSQKKGK